MDSPTPPTTPTTTRAEMLAWATIDFAAMTSAEVQARQPPPLLQPLQPPPPPLPLRPLRPLRSFRPIQSSPLCQPPRRPLHAASSDAASSDDESSEV
jgi:hypothetical protein